jgi:hypothetical protein
MTIPDWDPHVCHIWYLFCIGCVKLTKVQRTTTNKELEKINDFWGDNDRPLLRITYCIDCSLPFSSGTTIGTWQDKPMCTAFIEGTTVRKFIAREEGSGFIMCNGKENSYIIENPNDIHLKDDFIYWIFDFGRDFCGFRTPFPRLSAREFGRFKALSWIDSE